MVILIAAAAAVLVFTPHWNYPMPLHIDEWHHISEGLRLGNYGEYFTALKLEAGKRFAGLEIGFHFFLFLISQIVNLVLIYKFLPALWAALSALVLFYVVYKKTGHKFLPAWLAMVFFASIKSNVNLAGLWFFTPLTFSIPFIFLYIYFFTEGIIRQKTNFILIGLAIMLFLIPIHSISVLFALPALFLYALINYRLVLKKNHVFAIFILIPLAGILTYKYVLDIPWDGLLTHLTQALQFRYGWGILETKNSLTEVYSFAGYALALLGLAYVIAHKKTKSYLIYIIWPVMLFLEILLYRLTGVSYLSPYQRNLYYFAIALPLLSALGLDFIIRLIGLFFDKLSANQDYVGAIKKVATINVNLTLSPQQIKILKFSAGFIVAAFMIFLAFFNYYKTPPELALYHAIDADDYSTLLFMAKQPAGNVLATPFMSTAVYPISRHNPVAALVFYGDTGIIESFFLASDCLGKSAIIKQYNVRYVISPAPLDCNYQVIFAQNNNIIYRVQ